MEPEERKQMVLNMCICGGCPSWVQSEEKGGYCLSTIGKSKSITKEKGCICGGCQVYNKMKLKKMYYCTRGSEQEQSGK